MRVRTSAGGYVWVDSRFCFDGTRFYAVWRDISGAKKAEVRAAAMHALDRGKCNLRHRRVHTTLRALRLRSAACTIF